jgi:hypothetical protein
MVNKRKTMKKSEGLTYNNDSGHGLTGKGPQMTIGLKTDNQPRGKHNNPQTRVLNLKVFT